jgi:hypothetical protein
MGLNNEYLDCPCCGFNTLSSISNFELCFLCDWEDDGQDDSNADEVVGGPNGDYSLTEARNNFKKYLIMYRPSDPRFYQSKEEISLKKEIIKYYTILVENKFGSKEVVNIKKELDIKTQELNKAKQKRIMSS